MQENNNIKTLTATSIYKAKGRKIETAMINK